MGALLETLMGTLALQQAIADTQRVVAVSISAVSKILTILYNHCNDVLNAMMHKRDESHKEGMPPESDGDKWATEIQEWQARYNHKNQKFQKQQNRVNALLQTSDQQLQTLGNEAQQISTMVEITVKPNEVVARALQQTY